MIFRHPQMVVSGSWNTPASGGLRHGWKSKMRQPVASSVHWPKLTVSKASDHCLLSSLCQSDIDMEHDWKWSYVLYGGLLKFGDCGWFLMENPYSNGWFRGIPTFLGKPPYYIILWYWLNRYIISKLIIFSVAVSHVARCWVPLAPTASTSSKLKDAWERRLNHWWSLMQRGNSF